MAAFATVNQSYQTNQVQTAGPGQLLVLAYDGMLRFLREARQAMGRRDYETQNRYIQKTQAILLELQHMLDYNAFPELAAQLNSLYWWMYERLTRANVTDDEQMLAEVAQHLAELRAAWAGAAQQLRAGEERQSIGSEERQLIGGRC